MSLTAIPVQRREIQALTDEYLCALTNVTDGFWNDNIKHSCLWLLSSPKGQACGFYALLKEKPESGEILTAFYLRPAWRSAAAEAFAQAVRRHAVKAAYAASCDEMTLSLSMEYAVLTQKKFRCRRSFFAWEQRKCRLPPSRGRVCALLPGMSCPGCCV